MTALRFDSWEEFHAWANATLPEYTTGLSTVLRETALRTLFERTGYTGAKPGQHMREVTEGFANWWQEQQAP